MKRKVLLVIGKSDLSFEGEYSFETEKLIEALQKREDIELVIVGDYKTQNFDLEELNKSISELNEEQPLTIIMYTHGSVKNGYFEFILDNDSKLSSKDLFTLISQKISNIQIDIFTPACHGGGMLSDKDILPSGSTLVSLTDRNETNHGGDFNELSEFLGDYNADLSAYNLLQLFLVKCLKNRFHPHIGVSGDIEYSLDDLLKSQISKPLDYDLFHFKEVGSPKEYKEIFNKILNGKSEWNINAMEYGIALSIVLNNLKNNRCFNIDNDDVKKR